MSEPNKKPYTAPRLREITDPVEREHWQRKVRGPAASAIASRAKLGPVAWLLIGSTYVRRLCRPVEVSSAEAPIDDATRRKLEEARLKAARAMVGARR